VPAAAELCSLPTTASESQRGWRTGRSFSIGRGYWWLSEASPAVMRCGWGRASRRVEKPSFSLERPALHNMQATLDLSFFSRMTLDLS
jgi:hypothetical protein